MAEEAGQLYFIEDRRQEELALVDTYREFLAANLESILIGSPTSVQWPSELKAKIADTIVHGRLKYHSEEEKTCRVLHLETLTWGTACGWKPLPFEASAEGEAQRSIYCEAVRTTLGILLEENVFDLPSLRFTEVPRAAFQDAYSYQPDATFKLGAISSVVRDVFLLSPRPIQDVIDILFTSITGFSCALPASYVEPGKHFGFYSSYDARASACLKLILANIYWEVLDIKIIRNAKPGLTWKLCLNTKMAYVDKLSIREGQLVANWEILQTLSRLDRAHILLDHGVAFKPSGKKICYVGPTMLATIVMYAIADVYMEKEQADRIVGEATSKANVRIVVKEDLEVLLGTENIEQFGKWISLPTNCFSRETLQKFVQRDTMLGTRSKQNVATNRFGDCMFFVDEYGPWKSSTYNMSPLNLPEQTLALLQGTVHGYPFHIVSKSRWSRKNVVSEVDDEPDEPLQLYQFQSLEYKPKTLEPIINKPGRILVRRRGLRGNSGYFIVAILTIIGSLAIYFNWGRRSSVLERIFDAAQSMSLVAAVLIAIIFVATKTITSAMDWLGGVTEVTEENQLAALLGVSVEDLKIAATYEQGAFFWLSDKNSSFCRATKLGELIFSEPLDMSIESAHVRYGCVVDKDRGFWILQGWSFRIEDRENTGHMVRVPHEDTVYANVEMWKLIS